MTKEKSNVVVSEMANTHYVYMDIIRILATYLVIFTHTGNLGSKLYIYGSYDKTHKLIYIIADVLRCVNVPLFFYDIRSTFTAKAGILQAFIQ